MILTKHVYEINKLGEFNLGTKSNEFIPKDPITITSITH